jgi:hypothetical protein
MKQDHVKGEEDNLIPLSICGGTLINLRRHLNRVDETLSSK